MRQEGGEPGVQVWSVRIGSQGGFTGGGSGYTIASDGTVVSWSQVTPQDSIQVEPVGQASAEALRALRQVVDDAQLAALEHRQRGNMTVLLQIQAGDSVRVYTWSEAPRAKLPAALERAQEAALAAVRSARR